MAIGQKRFGEKLLEAGLLTPEDLEAALAVQRATGEPLGEIILKQKRVPEEDVMRLLCEEAGIEFRSLKGVTPDPAAVAQLPAELAREKAAVPLGLEKNRLTVAMANPLDLKAVMALERATGRLVHVQGAPRKEIEQLLESVYGPAPGKAPPPQLIQDSSPAAPPETITAVEGTGRASQITEELIRRGISMGATDIHLEPLEGGLRVRYRVDGLLREGGFFPSNLQPSILTRIKVMSGLDIAESRQPQDGRLRVHYDQRDIDIRVSTFPTLYGEDMVLRLLDRSQVKLDLSALGMDPQDIQTFRTALQRPEGLILITGPTGAGKTTTLYAALATLNTVTRSIVTLEDPVEYELPGVRQSQINPKAGLTFATGLRALLRHDPDVILVGEMRDRDTVEIGLSAALTGHLVLTTLHTNSAAAAVPRLLDMGAEPFVLASAIRLIVAQRLVRVLCTECRRPAQVPDAVRQRYGLGAATIYQPVGCRACQSTGYRGRTGIFELIPDSPALAECVYQHASAEEIQRRCGGRTLFEHGLQKVRQGITSLEEVLSKVSE
jgi:type IV pilus assembly protein PilB